MSQRTTALEGFGGVVVGVCSSRKNPVNKGEEEVGKEEEVRREKELIFIEF